MRRDNFLLIFKFVVPNPASSGEDLFFLWRYEKADPSREVVRYGG